MKCSEIDFAYLRNVVLEQSANVVDPGRDNQFEAKLSAVARTVGADDLEGLVGLLKIDPAAHLHRAVAEAMTINETSFFRDCKPFEKLRDIVLPALIRENARKRKLRIWSAACSTGQEAYSLAMLLVQHFPELRSWDVQIIGTDLSHQVIQYAKRGRYRKIEVNRGLPVRLLLEHFRPEGDEWQISRRVKALCTFHHTNLCAPLPLLPKFDVVMLRNVLLYFSQEDRTRVLSAVYRQMNAGGYLMLGNSEQAEDSTEHFEAQFTTDTYYYRPLAIRSPL